MKKSILQRALKALAAAALLLCVASAPAARQGGTTRYVYDDNGRLYAVITPSGEAVVYEYDAAGNITAVRRFAADQLALIAFAPRSGMYGDPVTIFGVGFGAGVTSVAFNGAPAEVVSVTPTVVVAVVPDGATTGPITVTTPGGSATTVSPFTVRGVRVTPATARVNFTQTQQFTAEVVAGDDQSVVWSVNGINGGNASVGTITAAGLYTAPAGNAGTVIVRASSSAAPELFDEAVVTVRDPNDIAELRAPAVSVLRGTNNRTAPVAAPVAVQYGFRDGTEVASSLSVSVQHGNADGVNTARATGVAVLYGLGQLSPPLAPGVSVAYGSPTAQTVARSAVSATTGPHVTSVSPAAVARNTSVTLTLTGANLSGATALRFIDPNGNVVTTFSVTNISVSADGTVLTATVSVPSVSPGAFVVVVSTPGADSMTTGTGLNLLQIN